MTPADAALPAWEILLDGKPMGSRCVASNEAEAYRWACRQNPALRRRLSVRPEVAHVSPVGWTCERCTEHVPANRTHTCALVPVSPVAA